MKFKVVLLFSVFVVGSSHFLEEDGKRFEEYEVDSRLLWERSNDICVPNVLQGKLREVIGSASNGKPTLTGTSVLLAFDFQKRNRVGMSQHVTSGKTTLHLKVVVEVDKMMMYTANEETKSCTKAHLPPGSVVRCLPKNATLLAKEKLGGLIDTELYQMTVVNSQMAVVANISIHRDSSDFLPLVETAVGAYNTQPKPLPFMVVMQYNDLKRQIDDPTLLDIPDYCQQENRHPGELPHIMKYIKHRFLHGV